MHPTGFRQTALQAELLGDGAAYFHVVAREAAFFVMIGIGRINPFRADCEDAAGLDVIEIFGVCGVRGEAKRCCQCKRGAERPAARDRAQ